MKIEKGKVIMEFNDYINLVDRIHKLTDENNEYFNENYQFRDLLSTYKYEFKTLNKKLRDAKRKFYRNRRLLEQILDNFVLPLLDEDVLKETLNLTIKTFKQEILKQYDEDIKYN